MPKTERPSRFRLPTDVRPREYEIRLEPDLEAGRFRGEVDIAVGVERKRQEVVLHAAELKVERATAHADGVETTARVRADADAQTVTLRFPRSLPAGDARLRLRFSGRLNQHLRGLYAASADGRRYAFSQCEAADARRIFPCFDEPAFKARFRLAVTVPDGLRAVSNSPIEAEHDGPDGHVIRFAPTPLLSTYLFALAVGALEASAERLLGTVPIRIWHAPGKGHLTELGLEAAAEALRRLEEYFDIPYPYGKLDLVAVPDFEAGAMENAGAVFFRETLLLLDPATVSLNEHKRAGEVIAHELAHMWYGDLVTMAWWDDLWLNEAFATWMAYRVVDDWRPEWRLWQGFEHDRAGALALDALANTHPIYGEVRSVAEATQNFDAITYEKGAAVVRMIEHFLGAEKFRDGVRLYMRRHREGNAVAADLWHALEAASGREVARVAQAWIEKAGFPLVAFGRAKGAADRVLRVRQERFFADPKVAAARRRDRWPLPLVVRWRTTDGSSGVDHVLVDRAATDVTLGADTRLRWYFGIAETAAGLAEARARLDAYLEDRGTLDPNLADPVVGLAARVGDEALYDRYRALVAGARTPQERRRFLLGLAAFRTPATIRRTLDSTLSPDIPTQDVAFLLMRLLGNPAGRAEAWKFLTRRWAALRRRIPPLMVSRLVEALPSLREPRAASEVRAFFAAHPVPEAARTLKQSLEVFRLNAELRRRTAPELARWLADRAG